MPTFIKFYTTCFVQTVIFDLHNCRYRIQMETGHCFGSVQIRPQWSKPATDVRVVRRSGLPQRPNQSYRISDCPP